MVVGAARSIREPRVVMHTTSNKDTLDNGYCLCKHVQNVVKENENPKVITATTSALLTQLCSLPNNPIHRPTPPPSHIPRPNLLICAPSFQKPSLGSLILLEIPQVGVRPRFRPNGNEPTRWPSQP